MEELIQRLSGLLGGVIFLTEENRINEAEECLKGIGAMLIDLSDNDNKYAKEIIILSEKIADELKTDDDKYNIYGLKD